MAREGGYGRNTKAEWIKTDRHSYAEAIASSRVMGQELELWVADAIAFHVHRVEVEVCKEAYREACRRAEADRRPTPMQADFQPRTAAPTFTKQGPSEGGEGRGPGRTYRR